MQTIFRLIFTLLIGGFWLSSTLSAAQIPCTIANGKKADASGAVYVRENAILFSVPDYSGPAYIYVAKVEGNTQKAPELWGKRSWAVVSNHLEVAGLPDGEYMVSVQDTRDIPNPWRPQLQIVVDQQRPAVKIGIAKPLKVGPETDVFVPFEISDTFLDATRKVEVRFRSNEGPWSEPILLSTEEFLKTGGQRGVTLKNRKMGGVYDINITAADRAGNEACEIGKGVFEVLSAAPSAKLVDIEKIGPDERGNGYGYYISYSAESAVGEVSKVMIWTRSKEANGVVSPWRPDPDDTFAKSVKSRFVPWKAETMDIFLGAQDAYGNRTPAPSPNSEVFSFSLSQKVYGRSIQVQSLPAGVQKGGAKVTFKWERDPLKTEVEVANRTVFCFFTEDGRNLDEANWTSLGETLISNNKMDVTLPILGGADGKGKTEFARLRLTTYEGNSLKRVPCHQYSALFTVDSDAPSMDFAGVDREETKKQKSEGEMLAEMTNLFTDEHAVDSAKTEPKTFEDFSKQGEERLDAGDVKGAIEYLIKAINLNPEVARVHFLLGQAYFRSDTTYGDFNNTKRASYAIREYQKALKLNPAYHEAANEIGVAYYMIQDYSNAGKHFLLASQLAPHVPRYYYNLGVIYFKLANYTKSIPAFEMAIRAMCEGKAKGAEQMMEPYWFLARIYTETGEWVRAKVYWTKIFALYPPLSREGKLAFDNIRMCNKRLNGDYEYATRFTNWWRHYWY